MSSVTEVVQSRAEQIMQLWGIRAERTASAKGLSRPELQNILPKYLRALADVDEGAAHRRRRLLESHLSARLRQGFVLPEIIEEILLLGTCVAEVCRGVSADERPDASEMEPLLLELNQAAAAVSLMYTEYLLEDEQGERAFLRRVQEIAAEARGAEHDGTPPLRERLADVLVVVTEAVRADGAAVLFPDGDDAAVAASVGTLAESPGPVAAEARPFFQLVAASTETIVLIEDVATSTLPLPALLRQGMQCPATLVGLRLPSEGSLVAAMYVGRSGPPFSPREVRRLEALGHVLSALLENAHLYAALRAKIGELEAERQVREWFVSVIAHDLRSPLTTAQMTAALIARLPESAPRHRQLADRIRNSVARTNEMLGDLLDANRVRAGMRLALKLAPCDLVVVVREAFAELVAAYGERFRVEGEPSVEGYWSAHDLRRLAVNLGSNGVKYGAEGAPVVFSLAHSPAGAKLAVHNDGPALAQEELACLFRPFARSRAAQARGVAGWGLGLTLVKGVVEAHGGEIRVESAPRMGTTFTVELPLDARPFQAELALRGEVAIDHPTQ